MRLNLGAAVFAFALLSAGGVLAEDLDCKNPQTQSDMTACEQQRQGSADDALNAQYKKTRAAAVETDKGMDSADLRGAEKALVKAQRAWVAFRDAECEVRGFEMRGGSGEPMLVAGCTADLTDKRTKELKGLADMLAGK